jgi:hypothetical protein
MMPLTSTMLASLELGVSSFPKGNVNSHCDKRVVLRRLADKDRQWLLCICDCSGLCNVGHVV